MAVISMEGTTIKNDECNPYFYLDFVPRNQHYILLTLFTLLFGLILATTCIDVVGAYYIDRLHFFGRQLETEVIILILHITYRTSCAPGYLLKPYIHGNSNV